MHLLGTWNWYVISARVTVMSVCTGQLPLATACWSLCLASSWVSTCTISPVFHFQQIDCYPWPCKFHAHFKMNIDCYPCKFHAHFKMNIDCYPCKFHTHFKMNIDCYPCKFHAHFNIDCYPCKFQAHFKMNIDCYPCKFQAHFKMNIDCYPCKFQAHFKMNIDCYPCKFHAHFKMNILLKDCFYMISGVRKRSVCFISAWCKVIWKQASVVLILLWLAWWLLG